MPRRDGTGPDGKGANTGRKQGPCPEVKKEEVKPKKENK